MIMRTNFSAQMGLILVSLFFLPLSAMEYLLGSVWLLYCRNNPGRNGEGA